MSDFKDVAHRTVVELFDLAKEQQAEIKQLKTQLNNMEACYIQVKKERDNQWSGAAQMRSTLKCVSEHFEMNELDSCMPRVFEMVQEALRGDSK